MTPFRQYVWPMLWTFLSAAGYAALLMLSTTAREVSRETAQMLFSIFSTPFILEATFALIGIFIVLGINHWRLGKEGDGWVYIATQESDEQKSGAKSSQRLQSVIFQDKPLTLDQEGTTVGILEGYLDLGMAAQALKEMKEQADLSDDACTAVLKIRIMAANIETESALLMLQQSVERFPQSRNLFAQAVKDTATWLHTHLPGHEASAVWDQEAKKFL